jgi:Mitochondrial ribosomal protein (VAR1)
MIRESKLKILHFLRKNVKNETTLLKVIKINELINKSKKKKNYGSITDLCKYVRIFYKKYSKKSYIYIKTFFYYRQLLFINRAKYSYTYLKHLKNILAKLFNKNVEFNLVNVKRFYLNSDILSESLTIKLTKNRRKMLRYMKNIKKKVKINKKKILLIKPILPSLPKKVREESVNLDKKDLAFTLNRKSLVFSALKYKDVTGFRLEARGRLTRRYTASRSVTKVRYKGNLLNVDSSHRGLSTVLLKGNLRSNLQFTKLKSKTRIGSFGIKG